MGPALALGGPKVPQGCYSHVHCGCSGLCTAHTKGHDAPKHGTLHRRPSGNDQESAGELRPMLMPNEVVWTHESPQVGSGSAPWLYHTKSGRPVKK